MVPSLLLGLVCVFVGALLGAVDRVSLRQQVVAWALRSFAQEGSGAMDCRVGCFKPLSELQFRV